MCPPLGGIIVAPTVEELPRCHTKEMFCNTIKVITVSAGVVRGEHLLPLSPWPNSVRLDEGEKKTKNFLWPPGNGGTSPKVTTVCKLEIKGFERPDYTEGAALSGLFTVFVKKQRRHESAAASEYGCRCAYFWNDTVAADKYMHNLSLLKMCFFLSRPGIHSTCLLPCCCFHRVTSLLARKEKKKKKSLLRAGQRSCS